MADYVLKGPLDRELPLGLSLPLIAVLGILSGQGITIGLRT
jgi:hypothetical protein